MWNFSKVRRCLMVLYVAGLTAYCQVPSQPKAALTLPVSPDQETAAQAYEDAMRPLDQVRASLSNWSPAELSALAVGISKARSYCLSRDVSTTPDGELYSYARLCSLGQQWSQTNKAAEQCITRKSHSPLSQCYSLRITSLISSEDTAGAIAVARELLAKEPLDGIAFEAVSFTIRYSYWSYEGEKDAASLIADALPALGASIATGRALDLPTQHGNVGVTVGALYAEGVDWLMMTEDAVARNRASDPRLASLVAALAKAPLQTGDSADEIESASHRFRLLGRRLPILQYYRYIPDSTKIPDVENHPGASSIFLVFPEWCVGCRTLMEPLTRFIFEHSIEHVHAFGIMQTDLTAPPFTPTGDEKVLPILLTNSPACKMLGAYNVPLGLVVDGRNRIRYIGTIPENAFVDGGFLDRTIGALEAQERPAAKTTTDH